MRRPPMGLEPWPLSCSSSIIPRSVILRRLFEPVFAGQSRNLWNVGGHGLGIFSPERLFWVCLQCRGRARWNSRVTRTTLRFLLRVSRGSGETESVPDGDLPATLVSGGSSAACFGRNRPDITFQGAPFEARRVGTRNGRAIVP